MSPEENNALRSVARRAWSDIQNEWNAEKASNVKAREAISQRVLRKYEKEIFPRFRLTQLIYAIGIVRGVLKEY